MTLRIMTLRIGEHNKKGVFQTIPVIIVLGIFLFATALFLVKVDRPIKEVLNHSKEYVSSSQAQNIITTAHNRQSTYWDGVFLLLFGVLWFGGLLVGYYNEQGGPLMIVFFILLVIALFAVGNFSDYWKEVADEQTVANRGQYPNTYWVLDNLLLCLSVVIASGVIVNHFKE